MTELRGFSETRIREKEQNLRKNEWKKWLSVVGRMALAYALVLAQGAWAT